MELQIKDRIEKDKWIAWKIGSILSIMLSIIFLYEGNSPHLIWKPVVAVFFPISVFYMILEVPQKVAMKFTEDKTILLTVRLIGLIAGIGIAFFVSILWSKTINFSI